MNIQLEMQLIANISQLLKRSIVADSALGELRADKKANFTAIFPKDAGFKSTADSFQPYIEEIADGLLAWQQSKDQLVLVTLVKKIEKLFKVMAEFEGHYQQQK